jgi:hypothetical protein
VNVHALEGVDLAVAEESLSHLENAYQYLTQNGWPQPMADGGRGGTGGFDLYLSKSGPFAADAYPDVRIPWHALDAVSAFAVVDVELAGPAGLEASVVSAYLQAVLLGQDPAEDRRWRRATGAFAAWQVTGLFGAEGAVDSQQREPWRSWISTAVGEGEGGALLLAMLSDRFDGGDGRFVQELWQFTRQDSMSHAFLRGTPDLWQTLERMVSLAGDELTHVMEDIALARVFAGPTPWLGDATRTSGRVLGVHAPIAITREIDANRLPVWVRPVAPGLRPFGSAYMLIRQPDANGPAGIQAWLRGEYGVEWTLLAARLGPHGDELGRISTPASAAPLAFLPIHLESGTAFVLMVGMHHSHRLPDADSEDANVRSFRLTVATSADEAAHL